MYIYSICANEIHIIIKKKMEHFQLPIVSKLDDAMLKNEMYGR